MSVDTMRQRFYRVTAELLDSDPRVAVVLAEIGVGYLADVGAFDRHPDRVINVGIREGLMIGAAAGMALEGLRPIAHSYAPFLVERTFEQVKLDFAHQGVGGILVSVGASYDWAEGGRTHHSPSDVAVIGTVPGWTVHVPGHPDEVESVLRAAVAADDAIYIRLSEAINAEPHVDGCGGITVVREGRSGGPTILAVGPMLQPVLNAIDGAIDDATDGAIGDPADGAAHYDATLLYTATVRPLDAEGLRAHVTGTDVVLVEPYLEGTSAAEVTAALSDRPIRLRSIGVPNVELRRFGTRQDHDRAYGLDAAGLRGRLVTQLVGTVAGSG
jgi:transketolase